MKRIVLFILTNLAVMLVLSATLQILGVNRFLSQQGLNVQMLLVFSLIVGFTGAIFSLLISKPMAKWSTGATVIDPQAPNGPREAWLLDTVNQLADRAKIGRPEVAIYEGEPNAFAT
ncbi:MAG TPA: zinc metalloprotease HtpX, partial [Alcaligenaceae bacterium]|nr:zinc metalloprotease HtpX [Alcaligenaceae bacterium]